MWTCRGRSSTSRPKQRIFQHMTGIWWHRIHPWKQNLPTISRRTLSQQLNYLEITPSTSTPHNRHVASSRGASHKTKLKGDLSRPVPQCPHQTPPLPGPPCSYPPLRAWSREEKEVGKKKREKEILTAPLSRIKRAERGWREVLGTACTAGLDQTERVPLRAPLPPRPGGRGGRGPSLRGLWVPGPRGVPGRRAGGDGGRAAPGWGVQADSTE